MVGDQLLGISHGDFILEFGIGQAFCLCLHGQSGSLIANPHTHLRPLATAISPSLISNWRVKKTPPAFVAHQELSFYLDGHVFLCAPNNVLSGLATLRLVKEPLRCRTRRRPLCCRSRQMAGGARKLSGRRDHDGRENCCSTCPVGHDARNPCRAQDIQRGQALADTLAPTRRTRRDDRPSGWLADLPRARRAQGCQRGDARKAP